MNEFLGIHDPMLVPAGDKNSPRVFVLQLLEQARDFSSAAKYGTIYSILSPEDRASIAPGPTILKIRKFLREMEVTDRDFFLHSGGDYLSGVLLGYVLCDMSFRKATFLRWDRTRDLNGVRTTQGFYVPVEMRLK